MQSGKTRCGIYIVKGALLLTFITGLVVLQLKYDIASQFQSGVIEEWLKAAGIAGPFLLMGIMCGAIVISPIPSMPLVVAAGMCYGPWLGAFYSSVGALAGSALAFLLARTLGRDFVLRATGGERLLAEYPARMLPRVVFITRLVPFISFDVVSYAAGLTPMRIRPFLVATYLGMLPLTVLYASMGSVFLVGGWVSVVIGIAFAVLFIGLPIVLKRKSTTLRRLQDQAPRIDGSESAE
jgi:uncharacterized membrane protein YdjX (TVP38/TMEM64 family)